AERSCSWGHPSRPNRSTARGRQASPPALSPTVSQELLPIRLESLRPRLGCPHYIARSIRTCVVSDRLGKDSPHDETILSTSLHADVRRYRHPPDALRTRGRSEERQRKPEPKRQ